MPTVNIPGIVVKKIVERSINDGGSTVDIFYARAGAELEPEHHLQGKGANVRQAGQDVVIRLLGFSPDKVRVVKEYMEGGYYQMNLTVTGEMWIKAGSATAVMDPSEEACHEVYLVLQATADALQRAMDDQRPQRRRHDQFL